MVLEKTLESPLDSKENKPANPKGNQLWIFIRKTDVEAETPILWPPDAKIWLIWKDPDAGKDWGQEENREARHAAIYGIAKSGHDWVTEQQQKDNEHWYWMQLVE